MISYILLFFFLLGTSYLVGRLILRQRKQGDEKLRKFSVIKQREASSDESEVPDFLTEENLEALGYPSSAVSDNEDEEG